MENLKSSTPIFLDLGNAPNARSTESVSDKPGSEHVVPLPIWVHELHQQGDGVPWAFSAIHVDNALRAGYKPVNLRIRVRNAPNFSYRTVK